MSDFSILDLTKNLKYNSEDFCKDYDGCDTIPIPAHTKKRKYNKFDCKNCIFVIQDPFGMSCGNSISQFLDCEVFDTFKCRHFTYDIKGNI